MWDIFSPHISSLRLGVSLFRVPCLPRSFQFSGCFKTEMRHRRRAPENVNVIPSRIWQRHAHIVIRLRRWEIVRDLCRATPQNVVARPFFARAGWCYGVWFPCSIPPAPLQISDLPRRPRRLTQHATRTKLLSVDMFPQRRQASASSLLKTPVAL